MFAFFMTSREDQDIVRSAVPEASHGLRNGEAIVVGEGVAMPMRICFSSLPENRRPKGATASGSSSRSATVGLARPGFPPHILGIPPTRDGRL